MTREVRRQLFWRKKTSGELNCNHTWTASNLHLCPPGLWFISDAIHFRIPPSSMRSPHSSSEVLKNLNTVVSKKKEKQFRWPSEPFYKLGTVSSEGLPASEPGDMIGWKYKSLIKDVCAQIQPLPRFHFKKSPGENSNFLLQLADVCLTRDTRLSSKLFWLAVVTSHFYLYLW